MSEMKHWLPFCKPKYRFPAALAMSAHLTVVMVLLVVQVWFMARDVVSAMHPWYVYSDEAGGDEREIMWEAGLVVGVDENSYRFNRQDPPHCPEPAPEEQGVSQPVEGIVFDKVSATKHALPFSIPKYRRPADFAIRAQSSTDPTFVQVVFITRDESSRMHPREM